MLQSQVASIRKDEPSKESKAGKTNKDIAGHLTPPVINLIREIKLEKEAPQDNLGFLVTTEPKRHGTATVAATSHNSA